MNNPVNKNNSNVNVVTTNFELDDEATTPLKDEEQISYEKFKFLAQAMKGSDAPAKKHCSKALAKRMKKKIGSFSPTKTSITNVSPGHTLFKSDYLLTVEMATTPGFVNGENVRYTDRTYAIFCRHSTSSMDAHPLCLRCWRVDGYPMCGLGDILECGYCALMTEKARERRLAALIKTPISSSTKNLRSLPLGVTDQESADRIGKQTAKNQTESRSEEVSEKGQSPPLNSELTKKRKPSIMTRILAIPKKKKIQVLLPKSPRAEDNIKPNKLKSPFTARVLGQSPQSKSIYKHSYKNQMKDFVSPEWKSIDLMPATNTTKSTAVASLLKHTNNIPLKLKHKASPAKIEEEYLLTAYKLLLKQCIDKGNSSTGQAFYDKVIELAKYYQTEKATEDQAEEIDNTKTQSEMPRLSPAGDYSNVCNLITSPPTKDNQSIAQTTFETSNNSSMNNLDSFSLESPLEKRRTTVKVKLFNTPPRTSPNTTTIAWVSSINNSLNSFSKMPMVISTVKPASPITDDTKGLDLSLSSASPVITINMPTSAKVSRSETEE